MKGLKQILKSKLNSKELEIVPSSFDIIGDKIVFSYFPDGLKSKQKLIGQTIIDNFKQINSVFKKTKQFSGKFRTQKLTLLAGSKSKEVLYKENGVPLLFDIEKVYFSPRLSTERKRIFSQVKKGELVLCLFSGCGVYPITILKNSNAKLAVGIEMNPTAHKFALRNVELNKVDPKRIQLLNGDVSKFIPTIKKKFDRILMPLPKESPLFLSVTLSKIKNSGIIHLYCFGDKKEMEQTKQEIKEICKKSNKKCRILRSVVCGQFSPRVYRWCIDFKTTY